MNIAVCIPHLNNITKETYQSLGILLEMKEYKFDFFEVINSYIINSRNILALKSKEYPKTLFVDADNSFNKEQITKLLSYNFSIVGAAYECQGAPDRIVGGNWDSTIGITNFLPNSTTGLRRVDMTGLGCCTIKREVFQQLTFPYFGSKLIQTQLGPVFCSEDVYFFIKCKEKNIPVYLDCDLKIGHVIREKDKRTIVERINGNK